jgi:formylglycine-generating enzyme required for sulfatase activity
LVHRDIKPANILLENGVERVKITDFGLARAVDDASLTQSGVVAGTPQYMSPEQAQGEPVDSRSDLFSLGSVLYAMCTGRPPFRASGTMAVLKRVCEETPRPIREINPEIPDWMCVIIQRLQAKNPAERFQSAGEVAELLAQHLAHLRQPELVSAPVMQPIVKQPVPDRRKSLMATIKDKPFIFIFSAWCLLGPFLLVLVPSDSKEAKDGLYRMVVLAWAGPMLLGSLCLFAASIFFLIKRLVKSGPRPESLRATNRKLAVAVIGFLILLVGLAIGGALFEYQMPSRWTELWKSGDQFDATPSTVVIGWNDPELEVEVGLSKKQETEIPGILELAENGWSSYSRVSPFVLHLNPAKYTLLAKKGGQLVHEEEFILSIGETRQINLPPTTGLLPPVAKAPFTAAEAKAHQEAWAKHLGVPVETTNTAGMKLVLIPPGEFDMGLTAAEIEAAIARLKSQPNYDWLIYAYEKSDPLHRVILTKPYYAVATPVTIGQFRRFLLASGYQTESEKDGKGGWRWDNNLKKMVQDPKLTWQAPGYEVTDYCPVTMISWSDAAAYCTWLSVIEGFEETYQLVQGSWKATSAPGYRLPTEAQWEFACRAGTTSLYFGGNDERDLAEHSWFEKNSGGKAHPIGAKAANAFGLFDMQGNVDQMCQDFYDPIYSRQSERYDPVGPKAGLPPKFLHVRRGGAWGQNSDACASGLRKWMDLKDRQGGVGFRIVRDIRDADKAVPPQQAKAPFSDDEAKKLQNAWAKHLGVPVETSCSIGMRFRLIPPGDFDMGTPDAEKAKVLGLLPNEWQKGIVGEELPSRRVSIPSAFYLGATELTVGQFRRFVDTIGYKTTVEEDGLGGRVDVNGTIERKPEWTWKHRDVTESDDHPVVQISLDDAKAFCRWLSSVDGREYYVPNEAEWEFACRAGTQGQWYVGDDVEKLDVTAWTLRNGDGKMHPVGKKAPNAFGLYDMLGNAEEVCVSDAGMPTARGGHISNPLLARCATRVPVSVKETFYRRGVRLALKTSGPIQSPADKPTPPLAKAPFSGKEAKGLQEAWAKHLNLSIQTTNTAGVKMVLVPPGVFGMGLTDDQFKTVIKDMPADFYLSDNYKSSQPQHKVTLTEPFYLGTTEVTVSQYRAFVKATGYQTEAEKDGKGGTRWVESLKRLVSDRDLIWSAPGYEVTDDMPVTQLAWNDAVAYCNWLSRNESLTECYKPDGESWKPIAGSGYRLPTEAEWEFACRAGTTTIFASGNDDLELSRYAWFAKNAEGHAHPVGQKLPNAFGLFDMHGNADEYCQDFWHNRPYTPSDVTDPVGPDFGTHHTRRGGGWSGQVDACVSALRQCIRVHDRQQCSGFRVVREISTHP